MTATQNFRFLSATISKAGRLFRHLKRLKAVPPRKTAIVTSASFAAIGPVYFVTSNTISQFLHPNVNPIDVTVSFLVFGSYGWLQTSAFYILGASFIALAAALALKINKKINPGAVVVFLVGVAFVLVGSNHVQVYQQTEITLSEIIHRDAAIAIVAMSPLACFLSAPGLKAGGHKGLWIYSLIAGSVAALTIIVGALIPHALDSIIGILERILLLNGQLWGEIVCLHLIWTTFKPKTVMTATQATLYEVNPS